MSHRLLREVFVLLGEDGRVLWSDASESPVRLPDSRARWEAIWALRDRIVEIAHSHPIGPLAFSREDATTMRALVSALGRPLLFSIVAPGGMIRRVESIEGGEAPPARVVEDEPHLGLAPQPPAVVRLRREPPWTNALRLASGMQRNNGRSKSLVLPSTEK